MYNKLRIVFLCVIVGLIISYNVPTMLGQSTFTPYLTMKATDVSKVSATAKPTRMPTAKPTSGVPEFNTEELLYDPWTIAICGGAIAGIIATVIGGLISAAIIGSRDSRDSILDSIFESIIQLPALIMAGVLVCIILFLALLILSTFTSMFVPVISPGIPGLQ